MRPYTTRALTSTKTNDDRSGRRSAHGDTRPEYRNPTARHEAHRFGAKAARREAKSLCSAE